MNVRLIITLLLPILWSVSACNQSKKESVSKSGSRAYDKDVKYDRYDAAVEEAADYDYESQDNAGEEIGERMLIKNGYLEVETNSLIESRTELLALIKQFKGTYISDERAENFPFRESNTITLRIPSPYFDSFLHALLEKEGRITNKHISMQDVTEEYLDIDARIKTKKDLETRYTELLKKAVKVDELLQIERELSKLREDIESFEGRLNYLKKQVAYSTLTLTYNQFLKKNTAFNSKIGQEIYKGWNSFLGFLLFLIGSWPYLIVVLFAFIVWRRRRRKVRH